MESVPVVRPPESVKVKAGRVKLGPGEEVGEHVTEGREEVIVMLRGDAVLLKEGGNVALSAGGAHFVPEGVKHNVKAGPGGAEYVYVVGMI